MNEQNTGRKYNGWTSYETWLVKLWLDNEEPSYRYWTGVARAWKGREHAEARLAAQLEDEVSEACPAIRPSVYDDLLNAALGEVDWLEIAESYLAQVDEGGAAGERRRGDRVPGEVGPGGMEEAEGSDGTCGPGGTPAGRNPHDGGRPKGNRRPAKDALPADVAEAIGELLAYVWNDEFENFIADEPAPDAEHIFRHIAAVDGWFEGYEATAEELVDEFCPEGFEATVRGRVRSFRGE